MTMAVNTPRSRTGLARRVSTIGVAGPSSTAVIGLFTAVLGAWAGIVGYVGPEFGYHATTLSAWQWTTNNWLLHLVPGAVAFVAGLLAMGRARSLARGGVSLAALASILAGAWLVIGPALWPLFESSHAYGPTTGATNIFLVKLGADLGPGILLAAFGGMLLKASHPGRVAAVTDAVAEPRSGAAGYEPTTTAVPAQDTTAAGPATRSSRGWSGAEPTATSGAEGNPPVE